MIFEKFCKTKEDSYGVKELESDAFIRRKGKFPIHMRKGDYLLMNDRGEIIPLNKYQFEMLFDVTGD